METGMMWLWIGTDRAAAAAGDGDEDDEDSVAARIRSCTLASLAIMQIFCTLRQFLALSVCNLKEARTFVMPHMSLTL